MQVIICYDISDNKLRYRLVKYLEKIAVRVQLSVFKAELKATEIKKLDLFAKRLLNGGTEGNMLIYSIENEFSGTEKVVLPENYLII